jgi:hypothetical protein
MHVLRNGQWVETDDVFRYNLATKKWEEVLAVYVVKKVAGDPTSGFRLIFSKYQEPPTNLRPVPPPPGDPPNYSKVAITWDAPLYATHYQVTKETLGAKDIVTATETLPAGDVWTEATSLEVSALAPDGVYRFTVRARRMGIDNKPIDSRKSSNKLQLKMGRPPVPVKSPHYDAAPGTNGLGNTETLLLTASGSDTWTKDDNWTLVDGTVVQGYRSISGRNGYGCVAYTNAFNRLVPKVQAISPQAPGAETMGHLTIVKVVIDRVYRYEGGAGTPVVEAHAWKANWAANSGVPKQAAGTTYGVFNAPAELAYKDDFDITAFGNAAVSRLKEWATEWIKATPAYNGLVIYDTGRGGSATAGYNGFARFRKANTVASTGATPEWQLKLYVRWDYTVAAVPSTWSNPQ